MTYRSCLRLVCLWLFVGMLPVSAQTVTSTGALSFGSFTANTGGSITVSAAGVRSKMGGVMLVSQGGAAGSAQFMLTGTPNDNFTITLPMDGAVTLSNGINTMAVNGFVSSLGSSGTLSAGGSLSLSVGATLTVSSSQATGSYSGSFQVIVNFE